MTPRPNALRIGVFALAGLALLVVATASIFGARVFADSERAVLHFQGSIYGLQGGAPVIFRGVRLGSVVSIGLTAGAQPGVVEIPVVVELDSELVASLAGSAPATGTPAPRPLNALIARGLRGQLATQSLLTGLLYVDLDLQPDVARPTATATSGLSAVPGAAGPLTEIPTTATPLQTLQAQLEGIDLGRLAQDVSELAASTSRFVASPELRRTLDDLAQTAASLRAVSATLERRAAPLADGAQRTLAQAGQAASQAGAAAAEIGRAASQAGATAARAGRTLDQADALVAAGPPVLASVQRAADELARTATALREATAADAPVMQSTERTLADVARAARAVRELSELLERQPEALLRGRVNAP